MTLHELARQTLDERWIPISEAKTLEEMRRLEDETACDFCVTFGAGNSCGECPLDSIRSRCCDGDWGDFLYAQTFETKYEYAVKIRKRIEKLLDEPDYEIEVKDD